MHDKFFKTARTNMVKNQILTNNVKNPILIESLLSVEKEKLDRILAGANPKGGGVHQ